MKKLMSTRKGRITAGLALAAAWNLGLTLLGGWQTLWGLSVLVNFILLVILVDEVGQTIHPRYKNLYEKALMFGFPVLLLLTWEAVVGANLLNPRWFPPPTKIAVSLWDMTVNYDRNSSSSLIGRPWLIPSEYAVKGWEGVKALFGESHVWITLVRVMLGFIIGSLPGVLIGVVMGINRTIRLMLDTTLSAVYVLPKITIFPIMMLIFTNPFGEEPKIAVVAISAFFLVAINTMAGVRDIEPVYFEAGHNYGANRWQMLKHVILPGALPVIFAGLRLALGTALIVIVAIEFVRAKMGVGFITLYYWEIGVPEKMYAGLVVAMVLGALLTYGLQWVERKVMPWQRE